jgi:hypothetical protein
MTLTGHTTRAVFDRYDIVNGANLRSAVERLAARRPDGGNGPGHADEAGGGAGVPVRFPVRSAGRGMTNLAKLLVPKGGLEPPHPCGH